VTLTFDLGIMSRDAACVIDLCAKLKMVRIYQGRQDDYNFSLTASPPT